MKALDTNILVRYYTQDDPRQSKIALRILKAEEALFVPRTVLIEFYFVLRYGKQYHFEAAQINAVLQHLLGLGNVTIEQVETPLSLEHLNHLVLEEVYVNGKLLTNP